MTMIVAVLPFLIWEIILQRESTLMMRLPSFVDPKEVLAFYQSCYDNPTETSCKCCQTETTEPSYIVNLFNNIKRVQHPLVIVSIAFALGNIVATNTRFIF